MDKDGNYNGNSNLGQKISCIVIEMLISVDFKIVPINHILKGGKNEEI